MANCAQFTCGVIHALQNPVMCERIEYRKYYVTKWLHNFQNVAFEIIDNRMSAEYVMV